MDEFETLFENSGIFKSETPPANITKMEEEQIISGMGIVTEESENTDIDDLLDGINSANSKIAQEEEKKAKDAIRRKEEEDRKKREEAIALIYEQEYEKEKEERERKEAEEEAEAARLAAEEEAKAQSNPFRKLAGMIPKPKEKTQEEIEAEKIAKEEKAKKIAEEKIKKAELRKKEKVTKQKKNITSVKKEDLQQVSDKTETDYKYLATHDELTHLKNKRAYDEDLAGVKQKNVVIMFFDVNNLKMANDTLGHAAGNKLILATAEELSKLYPENTYRVGGDEFIVLLQGKGTALEIDKKLKEDIAKFNNALKKRTADDENGLIYAVSSGYAIGDGKKTKEEIQEEADKAMYANKQAYKKAHPLEDARNEKNEKTPEIPEKDYDELLPEETRILKSTVKDNHVSVSEIHTEKILREIQQKAESICGILIADSKFDSLFIFQDVNHFLDLMISGGADYSYLYVVYQGGAQYYGADEYYSEITTLFDAVAKLMVENGYVSNKDILKIKGINIFKHIYIE